MCNRNDRAGQYVPSGARDISGSTILLPSMLLALIFAVSSCVVEDDVDGSYHGLTAVEQSISDGSDGALMVISANTVINDSAYLIANELAGESVIEVNDGNFFTIDDKVLIVQMQAFAGGTTGTSEIATIEAINGTELTLKEPITSSYFSGVFDSVNATSAQVVRMPEYTSVTINAGASITASPWNGYTGGIVAFNAVETTINGSIDVSGLGYRGGYDGGVASNNGTQGESYTGLGVTIWDANAGGGAYGAQSSYASGGNGAHGGGGGGHMTVGEDGGLSTGTPIEPPDGGASYSDATGSWLTLGSGGGSGGDDSYQQVEPAGGAGGGALLIVTGTITNNGGIHATGGNGLSGTSGLLAGGGGGAGGYVHIIYRTDSMGAGTIDVAGGLGGLPSCCGRGEGGNGGDGYSLTTAVPLGYDFKADAVVLTDLSSWSSANGAYTTTGATGDEAAASCWDNGPNNNRWFKFQATTQYINITLLTGGVEGNLNYPFMALWDDVGNEVTCERFVTISDDLNIQRNDLTPGQWYYLAVDNYEGGIFTGSFALSIDDQAPVLDYDSKAGAIELTDINNWSSATAAYTTVGGTPDGQKGSCAQNGPNYNRWFKFQATTGYIDISVQPGTEASAMSYPFLTLWDAVGNEVDCVRYTGPYSDISTQRSDLVPGQWYYISVDNYDHDTFRGTFSLSVSDQQPPDYDFQIAATVLTELTGWSSADAEYTTIGATPDGNAGSCWSDGPNFNRWFTFQATTSFIDITMRTGDAEGTLQYPYLALFDATDNELDCTRYTAAQSDLNLQRNDLTPGEWYYIVVDNADSDGFRGTFSLSLNDLLAQDYDVKSGAIVLSDLNNWSSVDEAYTTMGATSDEQSAFCWGLDQPNYNRWFQFVATTNTIDVTMHPGASGNGLRYGYLALWDASGNDLDCAKYSSSSADMTVQSNSLTPGQTYYIAVDNHSIADGYYRGTFGLSINDGSVP